MTGWSHSGPLHYVDSCILAYGPLAIYECPMEVKSWYLNQVQVSTINFGNLIWI